jgi:hypothetical protein
MAPRTQRGARKSAPTAAQYRRILSSLQRLTSLVAANGAAIAELRDEQKLQFKRVAQLQAELDAVKKAWEKMRPAV